MARHEMVHVVAVPQGPPDEGLLRRAAHLLGKEIVDVRLLLAGEVPRIIADRTDADKADLLARDLRDAGITTFLCRDDELLSRSACLMANTMGHGEGKVIFGDRIGGKVTVGAGDAFLIIMGRRRSSAPENIPTTKMKLNVAATVLTGGVPIMRRVTKMTVGDSFQTENFVRIFDGRSSDPRVEMSQDHIDYAFLGHELTPSTPVNFKLLTAKLREWFPQAVFDERLTRSSRTGASAAGPGEALEINCKLIYLGHWALEHPGPRVAG